MTPTMPSQTATEPEAGKKDLFWTVEMPKEIAEAFGVPEGFLIELHAQASGIQAQMDLTNQTSEARSREPGWFLEMTSEVAEVTGSAKGSVIAVYTKHGSPYVEIYPPLDPELQAIANDIIEKNMEFFEEMKRLGD